MKDSKPTVIVGAGIIGLFTAYYLLKEGKEIIIIDKGEGSSGCSIGNAGMIVPSHFIPLAQPGMLEKGLKWMFDSESPFYVKPRMSLSLMKWGWNFYKSANKNKVDRAIPALRDLGLFSKKLYQDLEKESNFNFDFEEKGLLMYCKSEEVLEEEAHVAEIANNIGISAKVLSKDEIHNLEPELKPNVTGGVFFEGDAHLYPNKLVANLIKYLSESGVKFHFQSSLFDFKAENNKVTEVSISRFGLLSQFKISDLIICTGSWTEEVSKKFKLSLPIQAGKGYSVTVNQKTNSRINIPAIFVEARVAITPMSHDLVRFGGTMEIGEINDIINLNRVRGILKSIPEYFPDYTVPMPHTKDIWYGLRPCSPDGLPYIGKSIHYSNLYINSGHAMMGISLATGSAKIISQMIYNQKLSIDIKEFNLQRFD